MLEKWTGEVVGQLHIYGLEVRDLAAEMGCTPAYLSKLLKGKRTPKGAESRVRSALSNLISSRKE